MIGDAGTERGNGYSYVLFPVAKITKGRLSVGDNTQEILCNYHHWADEAAVQTKGRAYRPVPIKKCL